MGLGSLLGQEPEYFLSMPLDPSVSKGKVCIMHVDFVTLCVCFWDTGPGTSSTSSILFPMSHGPGSVEVEMLHMYS